VHQVCEEKQGTKSFIKTIKLVQGVSMPVIKSAKKRVLQSEKKRIKNSARKSAIKTAVKKVVEAIEARNFEQARALFKSAESQLARAKGKGVLHANTVARKISRLAQCIVRAEQSSAA
jgi:small subunit ribosomal protein S20